MEKKKKEEKYSNWRTKRRKPSPLFIQTEAEKFYCPTISHHYRRLSSKNFLHFRDIIYDNKVCLICVPTRKKKEKRKRNSRRRCFTFFSVRFFERNRHSHCISRHVSPQDPFPVLVSPTIDQAFYVFFSFFFYYFPFLSIALRNNCYLDSTTVGEELFAKHRDVRVHKY